MWRQQASTIIRSGVPFQNSSRILLRRLFSKQSCLLSQQQRGQGDDNNNNNNNINSSGVSDNPLRDFALQDSIVNANKSFPLSDLKIKLTEFNNILGDNANNPFPVSGAGGAGGADHEAEIKKKFEKALLLENSEIRETALSTKFGPLAGRTVDVINGDTATAFRRLDAILSSNQVWRDRRDQRFYMKPGKKKELKRSQHHRKRFMKGFKRLMDIVKDANRKGY